jgi:hypothetical protein
MRHYRATAGLAGLFSAAVLVTAILTASGVAFGGSGGAKAPTPSVHSIPESQQLHYVSGPFLSNDQATAIAVQLGKGLGSGAAPKVLGAHMETLAAASSQLGEQAASLAIGNDRMVWVVQLQGPYNACYSHTGVCPPDPSQIYSVVMDAVTGKIYASGPFPRDQAEQAAQGGS